ncbi:MAG: hypothetical protein CM1200mP2_06380 [Planctomycetaceae bacterium]|nr:MAG: hypothetical protein CM1200mP2_06380 [Planctomycetaceae bacterium]
MKHLKPLKQLEVLWLARTAISNKGNSQLASLQSLRHSTSATPASTTPPAINSKLPGTQITGPLGHPVHLAAVAGLAAELPKCQLAHIPDPLVDAVARTGGNVPEALETICQIRTGPGGAITGLSGWKQPLTDAGMSQIVLIKSLKTLSLTGTSVNPRRDRTPGVTSRSDRVVSHRYGGG